MRTRTAALGLTATLVAAAWAPAAGSAASSTCADRDTVATNANAAKIEKALICEINARRKAAGVAKATESPKLSKAAKTFAKSLAKAGKLDHNLNGTSMRGRAKSAGYKYWRTVDAENIAEGQKTVKDVVDAWMADPPHRVNVLAKDKDIGVGFSDGYWVQDMGR